METLNKKKYEFLLYLLEEGDAMVCLDARLPEVDVPASHKDNSSLNLVFNLNFKRPFDVTEEGIFATLAFNGRPHQCALPFGAVWAIYDPKMKNGQVWEESIPTDMNLANQAMVVKPEKPNSNLKSVKTSGKPPVENKTEGKPAAEPKTEGKRDRSHLRVIK
jgi:stringent starvation protein B